MPQNVLTETKYTKLVRDIRRIIEEGKRRAAQAASQELVVTYWEIGKRITEEGLTQNAGYGEAVLTDLADELGMDYSTLTRCIHFFQVYNLATSSKNLLWSHYKKLMVINDDKERKWYEQLVEKEKLSTLHLAKAIREQRYEKSQKSKGKSPKKKSITRPTEASYVYKGVVEHVVDGDTIVMRIDLGFQVWKEQRIRLAEIDAPATDEDGGPQATKYVLDQLAKAATVVVKTNKIDIYGRYVGHIFYSFKEESIDDVFEKGRYLNQELVNLELAVIY